VEDQFFVVDCLDVEKLTGFSWDKGRIKREPTTTIL
jgi:hypothetical protein